MRSVVLRSIKLALRLGIIHLLARAIQRLEKGTCLTCRPPPPLSSAKKILVVRLDGIGDFVLMTPFLRELRRSAPHACIDLLVRPDVAGLAETCPYVDRVRTLQWPPSVRGLHIFLAAWNAMRFAHRFLAPQQFDLVLSPRWDALSPDALFTVAALGGANRVGWSEKNSPHRQRVDKGFDAYFSCVLYAPGLLHELGHNLQFLRLLGGCVESDQLESWLSKSDRAWAAARLAAAPVETGAAWIAVAVGSWMPYKRWPRASYIELCQRMLQSCPRAAFLLIGGRDEMEDCAVIEKELGIRCINAAGRYTIRECAALLANCSAYVGNDTGSAHIAAALNIPVVVVSSHAMNAADDAVTSPLRFAPRGERIAIIRPRALREGCTDCCNVARAHCITQIDVNEVFTALAAFVRRFSSLERV